MRRRRTQKKELPVDEKAPGATFDVVIERILPGGLGLAHADGLTLFVSLAAPGDRVRARVDRIQGRVAFASIDELLSASPVRVEPPCPYFGRCGGCDFQQLTYEAQLAAKVDIIRDCLHRIGKIDFTGEIPITGSPDAWQYRSRAQWQHDAQRKRLGYFERGSHRVCDVAECPVLVPRLQITLESLRTLMKESLLPEQMEFQAVAGDDGAAVSPPVMGHPTREVHRNIGGHNLHFDAEGFFQTNHELLEPLIDTAIDGAQGGTAIDLYCGVGLFTLPLAGRFSQVIGIDAHPPAISYARRNLKDAHLENATVELGRVREWLSENTERFKSPDFLLLDPPRTGAEAGVVESILALRPSRIAYVSCDPATLARDLKGLTTGGYKLSSVAAFDLFPQTHHVESVSILMGIGLGELEC